MSKKKNKNKKTPENTNHQKNTNVIKEQPKPQVVEQPSKVVDNNCGTTSKGRVLCNFAKKHKIALGSVFAVIYTCAIVASTLVVEHYVLPHMDEASVEVAAPVEPVQTQRYKMEPGQVYQMSPTCVLQYEGYEFTSTIKPKNVEKAGEYFGQSYVNENNDNIYLDVIIKYINKSAEPVRGDRIISMVTNAGGKSYQDIFTAIENKDGTDIDFSSSVEIAPGDYALVHCVFDVPKETKDVAGITSEIVTDNKVYFINLNNEPEINTDNEPSQSGESESPEIEDDETENSEIQSDESVQEELSDDVQDNTQTE